MADIYRQVYFESKLQDINNAKISIANSAVLYGLSTYTVFSISLIEGKPYIFRLKDHYDRLINSAKILSFNKFIESFNYLKFEDIIRKTIAANDLKGDTLARVVVYVDGILSGTVMRDMPIEIAVFLYPKQGILPKDGARLMVSSFRRTPDLSIPARAKVSGSYVNAALMKNEALACGYDDAIALDVNGHVTESTVSNIFIVRVGKIATPTGNSDILEGIMRDSVLELARKNNLDVEIREVDRSELYIADEVFLCGTSMDVVPILEIDGRKIGDGKMGVKTALLQKELDRALHNSIKSSWLKSLS